MGILSESERHELYIGQSVALCEGYRGTIWSPSDGGFDGFEFQKKSGRLVGVIQTIEHEPDDEGGAVWLAVEINLDGIDCFAYALPWEVEMINND